MQITSFINMNPRMSTKARDVSCIKNFQNTTDQSNCTGHVQQVSSCVLFGNLYKKKLAQESMTYAQSGKVSRTRLLSVTHIRVDPSSGNHLSPKLRPNGTIEIYY